MQLFSKDYTPEKFYPDPVPRLVVFLFKPNCSMFSNVLTSMLFRFHAQMEL